MTRLWRATSHSLRLALPQEAGEVAAEVGEVAAADVSQGDLGAVAGVERESLQLAKSAIVAKASSQTKIRRTG